MTHNFKPPFQTSTRVSTLIAVAAALTTFVKAGAGVLLATGLIFGGPFQRSAWAEPPSMEVKAQSPWLLFRVSDLFIANSLGTDNTGHIAWSPQFKFYESPFGARAQAGLTGFTTTGGEVFLVPELLLLVDYSFSPQITAEVGGGAQYWTAGDTPLRALVSVQGDYLLSHSWLRIVRGLFAAISFSPGVMPNWQVRAGADIGF